METWGTQHTHSYTRILGSGLPSPRIVLCMCVRRGTDGGKGTCEYVFNTFAFITVKMFAAHVILCPVLPFSRRRRGHDDGGCGGEAL